MVKDDDSPCDHTHSHDGHDDVDCERLVNLLTDYVEGDLPATEKSHLEDHLKYCPPCERFLAQYRLATSKCREALLSRVPQDLESRLVGFLRGKCRQSSDTEPS